MTVKTILTEPNKLLRQISAPVEKVEETERELMNDMLETMYAANGIGLAAPQVGIKKRIVVIDLKEEGKSLPLTFVNPKIIGFSDEKFVNEEGCLSVPEYYAEVERSKEVEVEWYDAKGKKIKKRLTGLLSVCIQHEIDHLDGILFIDHLSSLKRRMAIQKLKRSKKKLKSNEQS